jgi:hAT family C-terminal dimerisation region
MEIDGTRSEEDHESCWQRDKVEVARRVWEWWVLRREKVTCVIEANRFVALVQVSSASVERAFSGSRESLSVQKQLTVVADAIEVRLMERTNSSIPDDKLSSISHAV